MKRFLCLATFMLAGCGAEATLTLPSSFVDLPHQEHMRLGYVSRAVNAEGVVIAVRDIDADTEGGLPFWESAVTAALERAGYAKLDREETRVASGQPAVLVRFGRDVGNAAYDYWVLLCVDGERVVIVEAGGERAKFTPHQDEIATALRSVTL